jgi:hypothetical protein
MNRQSKRDRWIKPDELPRLAEAEGFDLEITVTLGDNETIRAGAEDGKHFTAFILRRWRQAHGITLEEAKKRLGDHSLNAYARYEQGRAEPALSMMERLIRSVSGGDELRLVFG